MNNNQFRKLVLDQSGHQGDAVSGEKPGQTSSFGAKKSTFMPMTPRTVKGGIDVEFARQVRERNVALHSSNKLKSSVPKGTKYAAGYTDRAKAREDAQDEKAERVQALEEQMKLGQISSELFEKLRDEIVGGDLESTHLVKGLDRKLLERVRRGEDVLGTGSGSAKLDAAADVDDELDRFGEKEVQAIQREKAEKRGTVAPASLAGKKRTRDEIMGELKAQRQAAQQARNAPALDGRWKKVGEKESSRIEIDRKGREVLIMVDEDGVVKRKVRKVPNSAAGMGEDVARKTVEMPNASKPVLGSDIVVPDQPMVVPSDDDDDDIFEGVGTNYNPLGDAEDRDDDDNDTDDESRSMKVSQKKDGQPELDEIPHTATDDGLTGQPQPKRRNYFNDASKRSDEETADQFTGIQNLIAKAAKLDPTNKPGGEDDDVREGESAEARQARLKRRAEMLAQQDRDLEDMDMGFGGSRYDDDAEADDDGKKIRLSEWKGAAGGGDDDEIEGGKGGGAGKKKRKPKKRRGDVNNAADIMRVIEGRRAMGTK